MSGEATGNQRSAEALALATLLLPATGCEPCAPDAWVDWYDMTSFRDGVPSIRLGAALGGDACSVAPGDVLLSRAVTSPRRAWVVDRFSSRPQVASSDWLVLRSDRFDPVYLRHLLVSNEFHLRFQQEAASRRRRRAVAAADVAAIRLPLPGRDAQAGIGRRLQHADALRAKRHAVAARLARLPEAAAIEMCVVARDAGWPPVPLGELLVARARDSGSGSDATQPSLLVRATNIEADRVNAAGCAPAGPSVDARRGRILADGDLVIVRPQGASAARVAVAYPGAGRWVAHDALLVLTVDMARVHPEYVRAVIAGDALWASPQTVRGRRAGGAEDFLRRVEGIAVPLPPPSAQARMAGLAAAATVLQAKLQASARQLDALLGTLRDAAFRGEL